MSHYESEHGSYVIPSIEWAAFKAKLIAAYNRRQSEALRNATLLYDELKRMAGDSKAFNADDALFRLRTRASARHFWVHPSSVEAALASEEIVEAVITPTGLEKPTPKMRAFALAKERASELPMSEATVAFDNAKRVVSWTTDYNNHTVERARAHPFAIDFFRLLATVAWKRGTGGYVEYRDENSRDEDFGSRGGLNNVHGPRGLAEEKARSAALSVYHRRTSRR